MFWVLLGGWYARYSLHLLRLSRELADCPGLKALRLDMILTASRMSIAAIEAYEVALGGVTCKP